MRALRQLHAQVAPLIRAVPVFAVDYDLRIAGLDANRKRPEILAVDVPVAAALRRHTCRRAPGVVLRRPGVQRLVARASRRRLERRWKLARLAGRERLQ